MNADNTDLLNRRKQRKRSGVQKVAQGADEMLIFTARPMAKPLRVYEFNTINNRLRR
jgi:hypothetical protein